MYYVPLAVRAGWGGRMIRIFAAIKAFSFYKHAVKDMLMIAQPAIFLI